MLTGAWEVALIEIQYPHTWNNIHMTNKWNIFYVKKGMVVKSYTIPSGHYSSLQSIITTMNELIQSSDHKDNVHFSFNSVSRKVTARIGESLELFFSDVGALLGFKPDTLYSKTTTAPNAADLDYGFHNLYAYCSLVQSQFLGDSQVQLLRAINVEGKDGDHITKSFLNPQYLSLNQKQFDSVEVSLRLDTGQKVPFEFGRVLLTLHFRKISPYFG